MKIKLALLGAVTCCLTAAANDSYVTDAMGHVVKTSFGECVRTTEWTAAHATAECDKNLMPKTVQAAPAPAPVRVKTVLLESHYDLNKAALRKRNRKMMDQTVKNIKDSMAGEQIVVKGYADRLGSAKINQKISEERAENVKQFLVNEGIPSDQIRAEGLGTAEKFDCTKGSVRDQIRCLEKDRKVEVEIPVKQSGSL